MPIHMNSFRSALSGRMAFRNSPGMVMHFEDATRRRGTIDMDVENRKKNTDSDGGLADEFVTGLAA